MQAALLLATAIRYAYTRDVDDAGLLFMRCVHSPGATRVLLANVIVVHSNPRNQTQPKCFRRYGRSHPILDAVLCKLVFFWIGGIANGESKRESELRTCHNVSVGLNEASCPGPWSRSYLIVPLDCLRS